MYGGGTLGTKCAERYSMSTQHQQADSVIAVYYYSRTNPVQAQQTIYTSANSAV